MLNVSKNKFVCLFLAFSLFFSSLGVVALPENVYAATNTISSANLSVQVDSQFPRVIQYTCNSKIIYGQEDTLSQISINGTAYTPGVTSTITSDKITYTLTISPINVVITMEFKVSGNILEMNITNIQENGPTKVNSLQFPNLNLISVRSTQTNASMAYNEDFINNDTYSTVSAKATNASAVRAGNCILYTDSLAATIESSMGAYYNSIQTVQKTGYKRTGVWPETFQYRGTDSRNSIMELPWAKVTVVGDQNGDSTITWQDGAIAYRNIMDPLPGQENNVAQKSINTNIFCNYKGHYPWTWEMALDYMKRQALYTDKFPQIIEIKSAHQGIDGDPSYGDANHVLGGNTKLNWLVDQLLSWNIVPGIHTSAHEAYPESPMWAGTPLISGRAGWTCIDREAIDTNQLEYWSSGLLGQRYDLNKTSFPNLKFLYLDIEIAGGGSEGAQKYMAFNTINKFRSKGWNLFTEYSKPSAVEDGQNALGAKYVTWCHTSLSSGNSDIHRFATNHITLLGPGSSNYQNVLGKGYADSYGYLGWWDFSTINQSKSEFWKHTLADTYLKNFPIMKVYNDAANNNYLTALLGGNVKSVYDGTYRNIYKNNVLYARLNSSTQEIFIPWEAQTEEKIYTYMSAGGSKTWTLPASWNGIAAAKLYKLDETQGRVFVSDVAVSNNTVTINYTAGEGYVLTKSGQATPSVTWGEGSLIKDMEFNSNGFEYWTKSGTASDVAIQTNSSDGNRYLSINGTSNSSVSQTVTGLTAGKSYAVSAKAYVSGDKKAILKISNFGGTDVSCSTTNYNVASAYDRLNGWTLLKTYITLPVGHTSAIITLEGTSSTGGNVQFDDLRMVEEANAYGAGGHYFYDGFEDTHLAGPFVHEGNDTVGTVSILNAPYTNDTIAGNQSFKLMHWDVNWGANYGRLLKTLPSTMKLSANTTYTLSFKYKPMYGSANGWSYKIYSQGSNNTLYAKNLTASQDSITTETVSFSTGAIEDYRLEFYNDSASNSDIVIDDITVDIGGTPVQPPNTAIAGNAVIGSTNDYCGGDLSFQKIQGSQTFNAEKVYAYIVAGGTQNVKCAIYTDNSGVPGSLLKETSAVSNPGTGWKSFNLVSSQTLNAGTAYWLAIWSQAANLQVACNTGGQGRYLGQSYGAFPTSISGTVANNADYSMYAEGTVQTSAANVALGKPVTTSCTVQNISRLNDGVKNDSNKNTDDYPNGSGLQWVQIDLGQDYYVTGVNLWHYWLDARKYHDVIVRLSTTADFSANATTVFNNDTDNSAGFGIGTDAEYTETSSGKSMSFSSVTARYVRLYGAGSTSNNNTHYVEAEVIGTPVAPALPQGTIMVIAPHEDDEAIMASGIIEKAKADGKNVKVVLATNGDYLATNYNKGQMRLNESIAAMNYMGVPTSDIIALGYADTGGLTSAGSQYNGGFLYRLYNAASDTQVFASTTGSQTYAIPGTLDDYHYKLTNTHGDYNRATFFNDLKTAINTYRPSDIYTTALSDMHSDHAYMYLFTVDAVRSIHQTGTGYRPKIHVAVVHAPDGDSSWPVVDNDPTPIQPYTKPSNFDNSTTMDWDTRERVPVPADMLIVPRADNRKYIALQKYSSQFSSYIGSFVKSEEIFWVTDFSNLAYDAAVTASSQNTSTGQLAANAADGAADGYPRFTTKEWVANAQTSGAWIQYSWPQAQNISKVVLYDRPNTTDNITGATLTFSDGSTVNVPALPTNGKPFSIAFTSRSATWVKLTINTASGLNTGLAEFEVY